MTAGSSDEDLALSGRIEGLATGYVPSMILFAAMELGVFDALDEPLGISDLAARLAVTPDGLRRLCRVLGAMGLLTFDGERVTPVAAARSALARGGAMREVARHHQRQVMPLFMRLGRAVRTGEPQFDAWSFASPLTGRDVYAELAANPDELFAFLSAMDASSRGVGAALAPALVERGVRHLVDLGCGGGGVARELLAAMPALTIDSFDLPAVAAFASERSERAGHASRHHVAAGDLVAGVAARGADAVLLSAILADWSAPERAAILASAEACLRPGGWLFVSETLLDDDRSGPLGPAVLSLVMLLAMRGDQLSGAELRAELERAGFLDVQVERKSPRDLVIARAPG
jgi:precorrin-6B methylase 2